MENIMNETYDQNNIISVLKNMGYTFISRDENIALRNGKRNEVLLKDILRKQLKMLNSFTYKGKTSSFEDKHIELAINKLDEPLNSGLIVANQRITELLTTSTNFEVTNDDFSKKSFSMKYIDWDNIENNVFHFTEEFEVENANKLGLHKYSRPDIVIFVNGIPLVNIELKKSTISANEAISQTIRNQRPEHIPHFFKFVQILIAGNTNEVKYGTLETPLSFWSLWREPHDNFAENIKEAVGNRIPTTLDKNIYYLLKRDRLMELVYNYTLFEQDPKQRKMLKKIARYQQFFAIEATIDQISNISPNGSRGGGLIWHTQGSGKSLTMLMLAKVIHRKISNAKIIVVVDRVDLDEQISNTFKATGVQVKKANSGFDLSTLIGSPNSLIITTVINKFKKVVENEVVRDNPNTFVLIDEAHRSQYGMFSASMKKSLPLACFIAYTGTPILKSEKSSVAKFGGKLIHKYTMEEGIRDKAILELLYEGRMIDQEISNESGLNKHFERLCRNLSEEQKEDLKSKWSRMSKVASTEKRLLEIAIDIAEHFNHTWKGTGFKGMFATQSKLDAFRYQRIFEANGDIKTAIAVSSEDDRDGYFEVGESNNSLIIQEQRKILEDYGYKSMEEYSHDMAELFQNGSDEIDILIVVDKYLTGFDVPRAVVLYIDKTLKDHTLLQAIARVNRLYKDKSKGFIVDYRGLLGNLDKAISDYGALSDFDEEDLKGTLFKIEDEIAKVKSYYENLQQFFAPIKNVNDREEYELFLADKKKREEFYSLLRIYAGALKIALSSELSFDIISKEDYKKYKSGVKFYNDLRLAVRIRYHEAVDFGAFENEMTKLMDSYIESKDVYQLTKIVNIFDKTFDDEVNRLYPKNDRAKADTILNAMTKYSQEKYKDFNPALYESLAKKIKDTIEDYKAKRISEQEYLLSANKIKEDLTNEEKNSVKVYPQEIRGERKKETLFDNLTLFLEGKVTDPELISTFTINLSKILADECKVDWAKNVEANNIIKAKLQDLIWGIEDSYGVTLDEDKIITKLIFMAQALY